MQRYPVFIQDEEMACGAYCILMILKYYGYQEEVKEIKKRARLNQNGITMKGMIECFKDYQIETKAYEASLQDIHEHIKLPCILYMIHENIGHFVVLYEIKDDEYIIGDPARGLISMYSDEMNEHYAKCVLSITHVGRVPDLSYHSFHSFLKDVFQSYRRSLLQIMNKGLWIACLSYMSSFFYQIVIDEIHSNTHFFYMCVLCMTYGMIEMMKILIDKMKTKQMIYLQKAINEDCVFQSSMNMFSLPYSFFYQDKGQIHSQISSFRQLSEFMIEFFGRLFLDGCMFIVFVGGMIWIQPIMALCVCVMLILICLLSYRYLGKLQDMHKNYLESYFHYQHHLLELIENQFLIRRYHLIQKTRERSYRLFLDEALSKEQQLLYMNRFEHLIQCIITITYVIVLIIGFYFFHHQNMTMGKVMMFYMLMSYCIEPLLNIVSLLSQYKQMSIIYEKYKAFECEENSEKEEIVEKITSITFDNVGYAYGYQKPLFEHIDLKIDRHLLLKGSTGSGKSTLLRLLMGYDMNYVGDILINQQELRTLSLKSVYQHIGYVCQTPTFLHLSLYENFLCNDEKKIKKILKAFHQEELINMFHITLDEEGNPLSLGQRQIVAIVRLLCQDYDVCIFDEAFSHMDTKLSNSIQRYLMNHDEEKIFIMVNHQSKTLKSGWDSFTFNNANK